MYNKYYTFGGVTLELTGEKDWKLSDLCRPFRAEPRPADHTIHVTVGDDMPQPPEGAAHEATLYRWREGERFCLLQDYGSRYRAFAARQGGLTEVRLSEGYRETASDRVILESAGLFDLLADFGMLILHSAYIVTPQGINGDRSLVRPGDGTVHGILYSGTSGICQNVSAPLRAIVLPVQGAENRVYPLRPKEAFMALVNQCAYYPWAADSAARMTELAAALIGAVPVYGLTCRKDEGAVRALEDYLRRA